MTKQDAYQLLEIDPQSGIPEIKRAYFKLVKQYPPESEPVKFRQIRLAYETVLQVKQTWEAQTKAEGLAYTDGGLSVAFSDAYQAILEDVLFTIDLKAVQASFEDIHRDV
jgi:DnaJ-class molecular chaperone